MKTPLQVYRDRQERKNLEFEITDARRIHAMTLDDKDRLEVIRLTMNYMIKYKKEY